MLDYNCNALHNYRERGDERDGNVTYSKRTYICMVCIVYSVYTHYNTKLHIRKY